MAGFLVMVSKTQQAFLNILKGDTPSHLEDVDLNELFELFHRHRLFNLVPAIKGLMDAEEWQRWKDAIQIRTLKSLHFTSILGIILQQLKDEGIYAVPLKGPVLDHLLYKNTGQRHFRDLDLFVNKEDLEAALKILKDLGYEFLSPRREFSIKQWKYYYKYKYDVGLINREQNVVVELHTGIFYPGLFEVSKEEYLWKESDVFHLGASRVKVMNKENTFLYLAVHGGHHLYFRLFWLRDVAESLRRWDLDHKKVIWTANKLKVERLLYISIMLVNAFFCVEIPETYRTYIQKEEKRLNKLVHVSSSAILGSEIPTFQRKLNRLNFFLQLQPGMKYRWTVLKNLFHRMVIRKVLDR